MSFDVSGGNKGLIKAASTGVRERLVPNPKARLKEQFHEVCRFKHLAARSEEAYWGWVVRLVKFHRAGGVWQHPKDLGSTGVTPF